MAIVVTFSGSKKRLVLTGKGRREKKSDRKRKECKRE
jgi:hypothetical protein